MAQAFCIGSEVMAFTNDQAIHSRLHARKATTAIRINQEPGAVMLSR